AGRGAVDYANGGDFNEIVENSSEKIKHKAIDNASATAGMIIGEPVIMGASKIPFVKHVVGGTFRKIGLDTIVGGVADHVVRRTLEGNAGTLKEDATYISKGVIAVGKSVLQGNALQNLKDNLSLLVSKKFELDMLNGEHSLIETGLSGSISYIKIQYDKDNYESMLLKGSRSFLNNGTLYVIKDASQGVLVVPENEYFYFKKIKEIPESIINDEKNVWLDEQARDTYIRRGKNYLEAQEQIKNNPIEAINTKNDLLYQIAKNIFEAGATINNASEMMDFLKEGITSKENIKNAVAAARFTEETDNDFYTRLFIKYNEVKNEQKELDDLEKLIKDF
ncbi:MAG: hypothetical protein LBE20_02085, partial [Deltaproteobacteria bacterium]|nr:hypothetical protein [Deltaproteobacteria bacterium]